MLTRAHYIMCLLCCLILVKTRREVLEYLKSHPAKLAAAERVKAALSSQMHHTSSQEETIPDILAASIEQDEQLRKSSLHITNRLID